MQKLLLITLFFFLLTFKSAISADTISKRPNIFGGHNYYQNGKPLFYSSPNIFKGKNYNGNVRARSVPSIHGGYNYNYKVRK